MFVKKTFVFDERIAQALEMMADDNNATQTAIIKALIEARIKAVRNRGTRSRYLVYSE